MLLRLKVRLMIDVDKINITDQLQGKNFVENSYLYFNQKYEYFEIDKANPHKRLSWKSAGVSNEKFKPPEDKSSPKVLFESFKFLAQERITYTHESKVNIYIVYLMPDITDSKGSDIVRYGLFGATAYNAGKKLVGYGVGFGTQKYTHDDGKDTRNLVILGINSSDSSNALVLGKGSIKITTNDNVAVQAKDKLKTNCTKPDKEFVLRVHYSVNDDNSESLLTIFSNINLKQKSLKLKQEN